MLQPQMLGEHNWHDQSPKKSVNAQNMIKATAETRKSDGIYH